MIVATKIACLQARPMPDFASASKEALQLAREATDAGAEFLALPEYCGGLKSIGASFAPPDAPENDHPVLSDLREFCNESNVWMLIGSIAIQNPNGRVVNRSYIIDNFGTIVSRYDKIHMFDIDLAGGESYRESDTISPGGKAVLVETPFGRIGHSICYDLRFPKLYNKLAQAGAEILVVPAAFTKKTGEAHWHILNRARAIENGAYVVAPCAIGPVEGGGESYGHSLIINPWGEVQCDGGEHVGVVQATINVDAVSKARERIPNLQNGKQFEVVNETTANLERAIA